MQENEKNQRNERQGSREAQAGAGDARHQNRQKHSQEKKREKFRPQVKTAEGERRWQETASHGGDADAGSAAAAGECVGTDGTCGMSRSNGEGARQVDLG